MNNLKVLHVSLWLAAFVPALCFVYGCGGSPDAGSAAQAYQHAFYSEDYESPHSQGAQQLSDFLTSPHLDYHLFGYNFGVSLVDADGNVVAFFLGLEHKEEYKEGVGFEKKYEGGAGFRGAAFGSFYKWAGFDNSVIETQVNPWGVRLNSREQPGSFISIQLLSGLMGSADATYRLSADVIDTHGKRLKADVRLRDPFGAVNQGYGTTSFYPHYITEKQKAVIMSLPESTIDAYLEATHDRMDCQGPYYYALPLMSVEQFSIEYDGKTLSGSTGKCWLDYFVLTADAAYMIYTNNSRWTWIAMQFPEMDSAINVLNMNNDSGSLPLVRLFNKDGGRTRNGARTAAHSWEIDIDKVTVKPLSNGKKWYSEASGITYDLQYRVLLESSTFPGDLIVTLEEDQELDMGNGEKPDYQGLGKVEGTLGGQAVHGRCWFEAEAK